MKRFDLSKSTNTRLLTRIWNVGDTPLLLSQLSLDDLTWRYLRYRVRCETKINGGLPTGGSHWSLCGFYWYRRPRSLPNIPVSSYESGSFSSHMINRKERAGRGHGHMLLIGGLRQGGEYPEAGLPDSVRSWYFGSIMDGFAAPHR